ncbi:MAG: adenylate/guanylate cyclase domain-containing protein [Balneolaceae bacterium]
MKDEYQHYFDWSFQLKGSPEELWPFISDTNSVFKNIGLYSIQKTPFSRNSNKGFLELSSTRLSSHLVWQEEPYIWEKPYQFGSTRHYKAGIFKKVRFLFSLSNNANGSTLRVRYWVASSSEIFSLPLKLYVKHSMRQKLVKFIHRVDECALNKLQTYELAPKKGLVRGALKRMKTIRKNLIENTRRQRIVDHLFEYIMQAEDDELRNIHPYKLAEHWGENKYSVLNVFLHAAKLDLVDFQWDIACPNCKTHTHSFRKMREIHTDLYCEECSASYQIDFNKNIYLSFHPNPLIRKLSKDIYCFGGPQTKPYRVAQHLLKLGSDHYLNVHLEEGTYLFKTYQHQGFLKLHVREGGKDNINIIITDEYFTGQEVTVSTRPNLVILNHSSQNILCFLEKKNWKEDAITASEVTSSHDFRTLFSKEILNVGAKITASKLSVLFTDLMNSTDLYVQEGDEFAIGKVMGHFNVIQQIVAEERGGIVKTIGDSVMAVFREPVSALRAVERIQQIFSSSTGMGEAFKLKAGIHYGDCTTVNLNDRIDYFGTTVNIASRLVDEANEKEIVVSEAFYNNEDVKFFIEKNKKNFFVKDSQMVLKGYENEVFKVKQIRMERTSMRLVI